MEPVHAAPTPSVAKPVTRRRDAAIRDGRYRRDIHDYSPLEATTPYVDGVSPQ
jgi:hypothetical protein